MLDMIENRPETLPEKEDVRELVFFVEYLTGQAPTSLMIEKYREYLRGAPLKVANLSEFLDSLLGRYNSKFILGLLDVWSRLFDPKSLLRFKLNAALALCECDPEAYIRLQGMQRGVMRTWLNLTIIGLKYGALLLCSFILIGIVYLPYRMQKLRTP